MNRLISNLVKFRPYLSIEEEGGGGDQTTEKFDANAFKQGVEKSETQQQDQQQGQQQQQDQGQDQQQQQQQQQQTPSFFDNFTNNFKSIYGNVELPKEVIEGKNAEGKELTDQERMQLAYKTVAEKRQIHPDPSHDAFMREYLNESTKENFDRGAFLKRHTETQDVRGKSNKELILWDYNKRLAKSESNPNGLTEDEISTEVEKLSVLDQADKADSIRSRLNQMEQRNIENFNSNIRANLEKAVPVMNEIITTTTTEYINNLKASGSRVVDGIELSEADFNDYIGTLPQMLKREVKQSPDGSYFVASEAEMLLSELISDKEKSFAFLPYLYLIKTGKLQGFSSSLKESVKKKITSTLDSNQQRNDQAGTGGFNADSFKKGT